MSKRLIEKYVPVVRMDGINTNKDVTIGVNGATANLNVSGDLTVDGSVNFGNITFDDSVTFQGVTSFDSSVAFQTNSNVQINGYLTIKGQALVTQPIIWGGSNSLSGFNRVYKGVVSANTVVDIQFVADLDTLTVTLVFESAGGGETVDFGGTLLSGGTLNMGAGAGDVFSVTFISDGTNWVETNRTGPLS